MAEGGSKSQPPCKKNKRIRPNVVGYLDVELPGQSGSNSGAHVTQEAVQEQDHFSRSLSPTSAPLIHDPWAVCGDFKAFRGITGTNIGGKQVKKKTTHGKHERSRNSADRELRAMGTQSLSASRDKQVETESAQNSARLDSKVLGFAVATVSLSMWGVSTFTITRRETGACGPTCKLTSRPRDASAGGCYGRSRTVIHLCANANVFKSCVLRNPAN